MPDIRISQLPLATGATAPSSSDVVALDGATTRRAPLSSLGDVIRPFASQAEAEAGASTSKTMTPMATKQSIASEVGSSIASISQGDLADSALQPSAIGNTVQPYSAALGAFTGTLAQSRSYLNIERNLINDFGAVGDGVTNDQTALNLAIASNLPFVGQKKVYAVTTKPSSFSNIKGAGFKVGKIIYPTRDFLRVDTSKITNGLMYSGWAQDKCYMAGNQIRVWVNEKESHPDGTGRIALYFSDDGGASYSMGEYLSSQASGRTLWSAGYDASTNTEYLFVRVPVGTNDQAPYTYETWKRTLGTGSSQNYNGAWTVAATTFPVPSGFTGQPLMVHSFTVGHSSSIVVGASYGEGAAVMRSTDGGATWTAKIIGTGTQYEEPTVKYNATLGVYCGFTRSGSASVQPSFWISTDNLANVSVWAAASGYFNGGVLAFSSVGCDIDKNGILHAYTSYRTGVAEGAGTDDRVSNFYLRGPIVNDFFNASTTEAFCLGQIPRREPGGSSSLGNSSVVANGDKIHIFYTIEEREGVIGGYGKGNRVADLAQTVVFLTDNGGFFDTQSDLLGSRFAGTALRKVSGMDAFTVPFRDAANFPPAILISGRPYMARNPSTIAVASDTLTIPADARFAIYVIDTEGAAATDNLSTITDTQALAGDWIELRTNSSNRDIIVLNNVGNIRCFASLTLGTAFDRIILEYDGSAWVCISHRQNA